MFKTSILTVCGVLTALLSGCGTLPPGGLGASGGLARPPERAAVAVIKGSEESSLMLDDFTSFIAAVDGVPVPAGRKGWNTPLQIRAGPRVLAVEFVRGVFSARSTLALEAVPGVSYELRFETDAQLFGHHSFCDFWIVDLGTGRAVSPITKAPVTKGN